MARTGRKTAKASPKEEVRSAGKELMHSLGRLGASVALSPFRLLPEETRQHLRTAGQEMMRAGIALNRGMLNTCEEALADVRARLDDFEKKVSQTN